MQFMGDTCTPIPICPYRGEKQTGGNKMKRGLIISGFAGIGKSHLARNGKIVDLESTPFNKQWELYANVAIHMSNNGYDVAISSHKELREELLKREVNYLFVKPHVELKEEYLNIS